MMVECKYCKKVTQSPCMNTRDMEDSSLEGDATCLRSLEMLGWGEKGERYIRANLNKREKEAK